jgi:predicted permease
LIDRLLERLNSLPGVTSASSVMIPVLAQNTSTSNFTPAGYTPAENENMQAIQNWIGPRYFTTLGIPLIAGRDFGPQDGAKTPSVSIINETFAKKYFKGDAVGKKWGYGGGTNVKMEIEVVGVVADSKNANVQETPQPFAYHPYSQLPILGSTGFYLRTFGDPAAMANTIRKEVALVDSQIPVFALKTMETQVRQTLFQDELLMTLALAFGALAAMLAAIGISGVMAYSVARRTREIGIRIALGADTGDVHWLVFREVSFMTVLGVILGVPAAYYTGRVTESLLFGVKAGDPSMMGVAVVLLVTVAVVSGFLPARRAARIDPMVALRYE